MMSSQEAQTTSTPKGQNSSDQRDASGWSASLYNNTASFVYSSAFTAPVLELLQVRPGEKILDLGCGSGEVTMVIKGIAEKQEGGLVVGIDASESMVSASEKSIPDICH